MLEIVNRCRKPFGALLLTAAAVALPAAWLTAGDANAQGKKTITAVMQADVKIFDPIVNTADITSRFALMVFDTLFSLDQNLVPQPQMVGKYEHKRRRTHLHLRAARWSQVPRRHAGHCGGRRHLA